MNPTPHFLSTNLRLYLSCRFGKLFQLWYSTAVFFASPVLMQTVRSLGEVFS